MFRTPVTKSVAGLATLAALVAIAPATASASTASRTGTDGHVLTLTAAAGEANNIEVHSQPGYVLIWERNNTDPMLGQPAGCVNFNAAQVQCPRSLVSSVYVQTGDRNDKVVATIDAPLGVTVAGGAGNDYLDVKGTAGGEDNDTIYARDGNRDFVACGTGYDSARTDKPKSEALYSGCEAAV